jgi:hypothetical protein
MMTPPPTKAKPRQKGLGQATGDGTEDDFSPEKKIDVATEPQTDDTDTEGSVYHRLPPFHRLQIA